MAVAGPPQPDQAHARWNGCIVSVVVMITTVFGCAAGDVDPDPRATQSPLVVPLVVTPPKSNRFDDIVASIPSPSSNPATAGAQSNPDFGFFWQWPNAPGLPIHVALLKNNKILVVTGSQGSCCYFWGKQKSYIYDVTTGIWTQMGGSLNPYGSNFDAFCGGHSNSWQGPVFQGGLLGYGSQNGFGIANSARFDYVNSQWVTITGAPVRYYPTLVNSFFNGFDTIFNFDGNYGTDHRIFTHKVGSTTWQATTVSHRTKHTYPRVHLTPFGRFFISSPDFTLGKNYVYNPINQTKALAGNDTVPLDGGSQMYDGYWNSALLMPLNGVDVGGGNHTYLDPDVLITGGLTYHVKKASGPSQTWTPAGTRPTEAGFPKRRKYLSSTLLPTGQVFVSGGLADGGGGVLEAEVWGDGSASQNYGSWFLTSPSTITREYHSVALLTAEGAVWIASTHVGSVGSDCINGWTTDGNCNGIPDTRDLRTEFFLPWYIWATRPTITSCPPNVSNNGALYTIGVGANEGPWVSRVALMRAGNVTHSFDSDQRLVWLKIESRAANSVTVRAPWTTAAATWGHYMLFVLVNTGDPRGLIPSTACWTER